jgi:hypothetical protein
MNFSKVGLHRKTSQLSIVFIVDRLEKILTMVYVAQNYWTYFGLYPSSGMWKTKDHNVSKTGSVSVRRWMRQDKPTQLGPLERASLNPNPREDGDRSSLRNVVVFCLLHTRRWIESKISLIVLYL